MLVCKLQISSSLLVLQNKVLRVEAGGIEFLNWVGNVTQYYTKINILKLDHLYKFEIIKLMHQLVNNKLPPPFFFYSHTSDTRANKETGINGTWFVPGLQIQSIFTRFWVQSSAYFNKSKFSNLIFSS